MGRRTDTGTELTQVLHMDKISLVALLNHRSGDDVSNSLHKFEVVPGEAREFPAEDSFQFSSDVFLFVITDKVKFSFQEDHIIGNRIIFKFSVSVNLGLLTWHIQKLYLCYRSCLESQVSQKKNLAN